MRQLKLIMIFLVLATTGIAQDKLTPELLWQLERIEEFKVSPDGKQILFSLTKYDLNENKGNADLYVMSVDGGNPKKITGFAGSETNPRWRPDGKKIAFLSSMDGTTQAWEIDPDGGNVKRITNIGNGISNFSYSPDMKHILFSMDVKVDSTVHQIYPDLPKANARIIDDLMYRHWDEWHDYSYSHVFIAPYNDGTVGNPKDIMANEKFDSPLKPFGGADEIDWSADGKWIAYTSKKMVGKKAAVSTNSEIYLYNIENGNTTNITNGLKGYDKNPRFSPDGKYLMWNSMEREGYESDRNRIMVYDLSSKKIEEYSKGWDRNAENLTWSNDGKKIYFISGEKATEQIFELTVQNKKVKQLTKGQHNYSHIEVLPNAIVGTRMSMSMPLEILKYDFKSDFEQQLTFINKKHLDKLKMGKVEERWVKTSDNKDMLVWVVFPPDFDSSKKYPTLLYCQGGPQSTVSQFFSFRWNFQLMAANGYIVVAPNRRGLPSFGQEWNEQISGDWGGQAMQDYLSAIDAVSKEPYVDKDRRGAVGASFGGYSVYWLAGNHDKRFSAFVSHCGLFNLESWYGTTEEMFFANWDLGGPYWDKNLQEEYKKFSPHTYVEKWDTPIMVIHGEKDYRVPIGEGMQAFQVAQLKNIPSRFLYYPEEGHWVLQPQNGVLWHREFFRWLDHWLKPASN